MQKEKSLDLVVCVTSVIEQQLNPKPFIPTVDLGLKSSFNFTIMPVSWLESARD